MNGEEDIAISIIRMEKLLTGITSKIEELIEKREIYDSPLLQEIIKLMELFKEYVISQMKRTPKTECMHTTNLNDCQTTIAETLSELEALQGISEEQNSNSEIFLKNIVTCINDEKEIMKTIRETSEAEISREAEKSMREMLTMREQEEARKKLLQSEIDLAERRLHEAVKCNLTTEKTLFDICTKVEREYTDLIATYDRDIAASHALMEKLSEDNEAINAETKSMEDQLTIQRALYNRLKEEREIALTRVFNERLELFRRNRAAKIIQRAWRAYFERISLKKRRKARRK